MRPRSEHRSAHNVDVLPRRHSTLDASLQEARQNGTLENLLATQTSLSVILAGSSLYPFALMSLRTTIYIGWGAVLFGFPLQGANWLGALLVLGASVLAFSGLGVLSASYLLIFKRGNPVNWAILGLSTVVGGMMYPISVLPVWLQYVARLIPVTYSLEGMRAAILGHASTRELLPPIAVLSLVCGPSAPHLFRDFFLGPASDENYGHAHAFLKAEQPFQMRGAAKSLQLRVNSFQFRSGVCSRIFV